MTEPPVNTEEDCYLDESFDDESLSEVEEEAEAEADDDDVLEESDSRSDSDVEAEFLRGNPHARRHQMFGKSSGGGSGFPRKNLLQYASSSSEDETQVVVTKTVAEVNQSKALSTLTDDETLSDRTLVPNGGANGDLTELEVDEMEDTEVEDEMGDEEEEAVDDNDEVLSERSNEEQDDDDVKIVQREGYDQDIYLKSIHNNDNRKVKQQNQDLVDVEDCDSETDAYSGEDDEEPEGSPQNTDNDNEMEFVVPTINAQKKKHLPQNFQRLQRKPILPRAFENQQVNLPPLLELGTDTSENAGEIDDQDCEEIAPIDTFNVKFLEQQMTQMSEMIMKTFRLSGGAADNNALEQLAKATKLMKKQGKKVAEMGDVAPESMVDPMDALTKLKPQRSDVLLSNRKCRCPSDAGGTELELVPEQQPDPDQELDQESSYLMDECGQGDGLMRYPHMHQSLSERIDCRVSSVTPTSFNSDNCGYHFDIRRPRSSTSSEKVNYKNLGRKSFSFTNPQVREIERQNQILLKKMMNVKPTIKPAAHVVKSSTNLQAKKLPPPAPRLTSAAVNRKKYQRQIDLDNDVLKRKLEAVGSRRPIFK
ncbi:hypothetical protein KR222_000046 [Zaprionus bogoriensis]|nr:hypothetical protein KR222_000046 [Zaprionus bogoriensis]